MKLRYLLALIPLIPFTYGSTCGSAADERQQAIADSLRKQDSLAECCSLEALLKYESEEQLVQKFGNSNVSYDTIWGAEGFFTMSTVLDVGNDAHVEILWLDSAKRSGMISATLVSDDDYYAEKINPGSLKSCTGLALGMGLDEVEAINARPFSFSGFGWDYGGGIISWQGGRLDNRGLTIQIAEGPGDEKMSDTEANSVLGDITVMSNDPTARKLKPRVWSISVAKVK